MDGVMQAPAYPVTAVGESLFDQQDPSTLGDVVRQVLAQPEPTLEQLGWAVNCFELAEDAGEEATSQIAHVWRQLMQADLSLSIDQLPMKSADGARMDRLTSQFEHAVSVHDQDVQRLPLPAADHRVLRATGLDVQELVRRLEGLVADVERISSRMRLDSEQITHDLRARICVALRRHAVEAASSVSLDGEDGGLEACRQVQELNRRLQEVRKAIKPRRGHSSAEESADRGLRHSVSAPALALKGSNSLLALALTNSTGRAQKGPFTDPLPRLESSQDR